MQKQSARLWWRGKDHKDIWFQGKYHCALYKGDELIWFKALERKWLVWTRDNGWYSHSTVLGVFDAETKKVRWNTQFSPYPYGKAYRTDERIYVYGGRGSSGDTVAISDQWGSCYQRYQAHDNMTLFPLDDNRLFMLETQYDGTYHYAFYIGSFDEEGDFAFRKVGENAEKAYLEYKRTYGYTFGHFFVYVKEGTLCIMDADSGELTYSEMFGSKPITYSDFAQDGDTVYCFHYSGDIGAYINPCVSVIQGGVRGEKPIPIAGTKNIANICGIKKNGRFYVYEQSRNTSYKFTSHILCSDDLDNWQSVALPASIKIPFVSPWNVDGNVFTHVQIKFDLDAETEDGCLEILFCNLFINIKESSVNAYYESGMIDDTKKGMMLGDIHYSGIYNYLYCIYLDNMIFQKSENNIAFWY